MSNQLPKFEDLSPQEVNDMIGVEIMGWEFAHDWKQDLGAFDGPRTKDPSLYWITKHYVGGVNTDSLRKGAHSFELLRRNDFDPYHDLNDCRMVEEKLMPSRTGDLSLAAVWSKYEEFLTQSRSPTDWTEICHIHASSQQKCHAMLLAKGLCK